MSDFIDKLKLAEKAAEDIYFAKVNRELIDALHKQARTEKASMQSSDQARSKASREWSGKLFENLTASI